MKSKKLICGALAATLTLSVAFSGCSLLSTLNEEDMKQTIATVDISKSSSLAQEGLDGYKSAITSTDIIKRDLIAAFINVGYSSLTQSGLSYASIFNSLVTQLTNNAVITQYATLYMLDEKSKQDSDALAQFTDASKTEAQKYEYLLGGEASEQVMLARYSLYSSVNSSLDSIEEDIIKSTGSTAGGTESRTTPTGVDTEVEDFYPQTASGELDYAIYTGYEGYLLDDSGLYKDDALEGTNRNTRRRAYSTFVNTLKQNYLVSAEDTDITDVLSISYIEDEYVAQLKQQVINSYYELFENQQQELLKKQDENGVYTVIEEKYNTYVTNAKISNSTVSSFEANMGSLSDTSFVLYAPATEGTEGGTFGYVYNILLPFNAVQQQTLTQYSSALSSDGIDQGTYYLLRKELMSRITTTDQRSAWFNGATDYSFDALEEGWTAGEADAEKTFYNGDDASRKYLFFENNLVNNQRYEQLDRYAGKYSYNGTVVKTNDDKYYLVPQTLDINDMLVEFSAYVNYVLGDDNATSYEISPDYDVASAEDYYIDGNEEEIDYSKFVYATGKVDIGVASKLDMFTGTSKQYKAMSAINELQYAYTTDTGVLSQYIGYTVSAYDTDYIKEFEHAAKEAVEAGAGNFSVCAGDYGWHLVYVTDTFDVVGGEVYAGAQWNADRVETEGTFENLFYTWIKDSELKDITSNQSSTIIQTYGGSATVTLFEDAYKDLLEM